MKDDLGPTPENRRRLARNLQKFMQELGWSTAELTARVFPDRPAFYYGYVSNWALGKRYPNPENRERLARALGMSFREVMFDNPPTPKPPAVPAGGAAGVPSDNIGQLSSPADDAGNMNVSLGEGGETGGDSQARVEIKIAGLAEYRIGEVIAAATSLALGSRQERMGDRREHGAAASHPGHPLTKADLADFKRAVVARIAGMMAVMMVLQIAVIAIFIGELTRQ